MSETKREQAMRLLDQVGAILAKHVTFSHNIRGYGLEIDEVERLIELAQAEMKERCAKAA